MLVAIDGTYFSLQYSAWSLSIVSNKVFNMNPTELKSPLHTRAYMISAPMILYNCLALAVVRVIPF